MRAAHFIFYVADQRISADFYRKALDAEPRLDVPGMTEFDLVGGAVLGLMPETGIRRLLDGAFPDPTSAPRAPRAELYLVGEDAQARFDRAVSAGARPLSPPLRRDWGHLAGYCLDPDGHVLAFAEPL